MKKIISLILAVLMIATLGSVLVTAVAADDAASEEEVYLYRNGVLCDPEPFSFVDAQYLVGMDTYKVEGETSTYTIKLIKNVAATGSFIFGAANANVIIDGELEDGSNAVLALTPVTSNANSLRFEGGAHYVLKNLDLTGSNIGGCFIQVKTTAALDIVDTNITTTKEKYCTINMMRSDGGIGNLNIVRSTITQLDPAVSNVIGQDGISGTADDYQQIDQRGIIVTCNAGDDGHFNINIVDSTLKSESSCLFVSRGSTADIDVVNSTLEALAGDFNSADNTGVFVGRKSSDSEKWYYNKYGDNDFNVRTAVQIDPIVVKTENTLRDGTYNTITFDATNSLLKAPAWGEALHLPIGYAELDYTAADPYTVYTQPTAPLTPNADKTAALRAGITANYQVGEPNANVKTDVTGLGLLECPVVQLPTAEETTTAGETTTATPGGNTTTADPETTTADPEGDDTTPPADDQTTAPADDQTTAPAGDDVTTAADDAAAGGCAGCNDAGAGAAIALAVAMAAAVAIIVKKK